VLSSELFEGEVTAILDEGFEEMVDRHWEDLFAHFEFIIASV